MITPLPRIDAHTHLFYEHPFLLPLLDRWAMRAVVINITGKGFFPQSMQARWRAMLALKEAHPERFLLCTSFDPAGIAEPGFGQAVVRRLREEIRQGAALVKIWKDIGLDLTDAQGRYIQVTDERFQPIWDFLAEEGVPVLAHLAEPRAAWLPLDRKSPHYQYYHAHPEHHLYHSETIPSWEYLIEARDTWLDRNPSLTVVGAHLGSMAHDVREVARRLDDFPNFFVDTAERFGDLVTQPSERVRDFMVRYQDRILYGTDVILAEPPAPDRDAAASAAAEAGYEHLLATHDAYLGGSGPIEIADKLIEPVRIPALNLPRPVLEQILRRNAERLYD